MMFCAMCLFELIKKCLILSYLISYLFFSSFFFFIIVFFFFLPLPPTLPVLGLVTVLPCYLCCLSHSALFFTRIRKEQCNRFEDQGRKNVALCCWSCFFSVDIHIFWLVLVSVLFNSQRVKTRTVYLKATHCWLLLLFAFQGLRTRMVYLCYIACLRYTVLVRNPWFVSESLSNVQVIVSMSLFVSLEHNLIINNNDNVRIQRCNSRFFTISSLHCEMSPTCTLKWPRHNRVQITCNTSSACHMQHAMLCATLYAGTAQLLSLTEFKIAFVWALFYWFNHYIFRNYSEQQQSATLGYFEITISRFNQSLEFVAEMRILTEMKIKNHRKNMFRVKKSTSILFFSMKSKMMDL